MDLECALFMFKDMCLFLRPYLIDTEAFTDENLSDLIPLCAAGTWSLDSMNGQGYKPSSALLSILLHKKRKKYLQILRKSCSWGGGRSCLP